MINKMKLELKIQPEIFDYFDKKHRIVILQDDIDNLFSQLPKDFFSLIITSPPYNVGKSYEKQMRFEDYLSWQKKIIEKLVSLLKPTGSICWQVGNYVDNGEVFPLDIYFYPIFKELGLKLRNRMIWHFEHGLHASKRFSGRYETLLWFTKSDNYTFNLDNVRIAHKYPGKLHYKGDKRGLPSCNPLGKNPSDFWNLITEEFEGGTWEFPNVKSNHPEKTSHPCQFPIELVERCVLALTNEDEWVLDPFAGVGSALIAAIKNKRRALGIECQKEYCKIAKQRIKDFYSGSLKIRPIGKPIHNPSGREKVTQIPIQWLEKKYK